MSTKELLDCLEAHANMIPGDKPVLQLSYPGSHRGNTIRREVYPADVRQLVQEYKYLLSRQEVTNQWKINL